ncbi:hypothetical protein ABCY62_10945 [Acetivibrio clariflavus]|uniref:hypothetical protein n=1 Tax=Acetivibrio clariflavus TaxID=288965 RepID=UPI0031F4D0FA
MIRLDEFRKPFEYEEETGVIWPVRIFCILLISVEMFFCVICLFQLTEILAGIPKVRFAAVVLTVLFMVYILVTITFLYKKAQKHAVKMAKCYLITRLFYFIPSILIIFSHTINDKNVIGSGYGKFQSVRDIIIMLLITPLIYILSFSILWYFYFIKSKRIKEEYEKV